jgi:hypothetical protein
MLEVAEHALDEIALAIGGLVERIMSAAFEKKAGRPSLSYAALGGQATACRNCAGQRCRDSNVAEMARRRFDGDGASARADDGVDFCGAAAPRAANRLRRCPPFPPAAERWALAVVLSMA